MCVCVCVSVCVCVCVCVCVKDISIHCIHLISLNLITNRNAKPYFSSLHIRVYLISDSLYGHSRLQQHTSHPHTHTHTHIYTTAYENTSNGWVVTFAVGQVGCPLTAVSDTAIPSVRHDATTAINVSQVTSAQDCCYTRRLPHSQVRVHVRTVTRHTCN
jgi:hypothetical protein